MEGRKRENSSLLYSSEDRVPSAFMSTPREQSDRLTRSWTNRIDCLSHHFHSFPTWCRNPLPRWFNAERWQISCTSCLTHLEKERMKKSLRTQSDTTMKKRCSVFRVLKHLEERIDQDNKYSRLRRQNNFSRTLQYFSCFFSDIYLNTEPNITVQEKERRRRRNNNQRRGERLQSAWSTSWLSS